jgi:hypothetical protein
MKTRTVLDRFHDSSKDNSQCLMLYALGFMLYALYFKLYALCSMLYALCSMLYALCSMLYALCSMLCSMLYALCSMLYALCSMLYALCSMLYALCSMLYNDLNLIHVVGKTNRRFLVPICRAPGDNFVSMNSNAMDRFLWSRKGSSKLAIGALPHVDRLVKRRTDKVGPSNRG